MKIDDLKPGMWVTVGGVPVELTDKYVAAGGNKLFSDPANGLLNLPWYRGFLRGIAKCDNPEVQGVYMTKQAAEGHSGHR